jgi:hypothetical protein
MVAMSASPDLLFLSASALGHDGTSAGEGHGRVGVDRRRNFKLKTGKLAAAPQIRAARQPSWSVLNDSYAVRLQSFDLSEPHLLR